MDLTMCVTVSVALVLLLAGEAGCLQCFQCSASGPGSACETDVDALSEARSEGGSYSKNCTIENMAYCVIELSHNRGKVSTFIRDCSDGKTFSFDKIPRLQNIWPTNQTTCATYGTSGTVVCMSLCRQDFCNGPLSSGTASSAGSRIYWHVVVSVVALSTVMSSALGGIL